MNKAVCQCVLEAEAKALATCAGDNINVVPVSFVRIVGENIWLIDFFMEKTVRNLITNPRASLVCWKNTMGYQLKGSIEYLQQGELYDQACRWVATINPDRKVKGLIIFTPKEIFDIAPAKDTETQMKAFPKKAGDLC